MDPLEFGDRRFEVISSSTVEHDIVLANLLGEAGIREAIYSHLEDSEDAVNAAITSALASSGKLFQIIGAAVVPEGTHGLTWTPKLQAETAAFFAQLPSEGNTKRVLIAGVSLVRAFFMVELLFTLTSRKSLRNPTASEQLKPGVSAATTS